MDDGGTAGTMFSNAAPALALVAAAVPRGALTRVRRARAIGSERAPPAGLGVFFCCAAPLEASRAARERKRKGGEGFRKRDENAKTTTLRRPAPGR